MTFGRTDAREASVAQHVPYMRHVEEDMLKTKEGHFMMVVKVGGFCFQTADQVEIDMRLSSRNTIIRSMNDSRFAVWSHIVRREVTPEIGGDFDNFFCAELNRRYMETQVHKRMFVNDLYVTIIRRGFQGKVGMADKATNFFRKGMGVDPAELRLEAKRELRDTVGNYCKEMASYGARVLGCVMRESVVCTEIGEFLALLLNGGTPLSMALPRMRLDEYLPTKRITFGKKALEFPGATQNETRFGGMLSIREADAIVAMLEDWHGHDPFRNWLTTQQKHPAGIGVICMYAAQRDLIRRKILQSALAYLLDRHLKVGTVDSYQGKENPIILLSLVRNNEEGPMEDGVQRVREGFLNIPNRINVAASRAMDRLVVVGLRGRWSPHGPIRLPASRRSRSTPRRKN
jgi:hypothetical protein